MSTTASDVENGNQKKSFWNSYGNQIISGGSSLIGSGLNILGSVIANKQQQKMLDQQNQFSKSEREAAQQWELDMWHKQNEYNSPLAQKNRMLEAGLNPYNLGIGDSVAGQLNSQGANAVSVPTAHKFDVGNAFNQFADNMFKSSLLRSQITNIDANTNKTNAETTGTILNNDFFRDVVGHRKEMERLGVQKILAEIDLTKQQKNESFQREGLMLAEETYQYLNNQEKQELNKWLPLKQQVSYIQSIATLRNLWLEGDLTAKEYELYEAKIVEAFANANQANSNANLNKQLHKFNEKSLRGKSTLANLQTFLGLLQGVDDIKNYYDFGRGTKRNEAVQGYEISGLKNSDIWTWIDMFGQGVQGVSPFVPRTNINKNVGAK